MAAAPWLSSSRSPTPPTRGCADYRDLRDVQLRKHLEAEHGLFLAEGEKVVRRAAEAGFAPRSFLMAPRWLDGLADVLAATDAPCFVVSEALAEEVTGFHVHRGALASLPPSSAAHRRPRCSTAPARSWSSRTSSTTPTSARSSAPAPRWGSTRCSSRRAAPTRSTAARSRSRWARCSRCRGPACPTGTTRCRRCARAGFTTVAMALADDAVDDRGGGRRGRPGSRWCSAREGHGLSSRWQQTADRRAIIPMTAGIDSLNVAAAAAVACYVAARSLTRSRTGGASSADVRPCA